MTSTGLLCGLNQLLNLTLLASWRTDLTKECLRLKEIPLGFSQKALSGCYLNSAPFTNLCSCPTTPPRRGLADLRAVGMNQLTVPFNFPFFFFVSQEDEVFPAMPLGQTSPAHIWLIKDQEKMIGQHLQRWYQRSSWIGSNEGLQVLWTRGRAPHREGTLNLGGSVTAKGEYQEFAQVV